MSGTARTPAVVHGSFAVLCAATLLVLALTGAVGRGLTLTLVSAVAAVWVLRALLRRGLGTSPIWWFLVVGLAFLTVTNLTWLLAVDLGGAVHPPQPFTQISLALGYLSLLGACVAVITPAARRDTGGVLDAAIIGVGGASVLWMVILSPALERADATGATRLYVLVVVLVLSGITGALLRVAATAAAARPSLSYFLVAVSLTLAGNVLQVVVGDPGTGAVPSWISTVWTLAYTAAWAAAAHPTSSAITVTGRSVEARLTRRRVVALGIALGAGPVLAVSRELSGRQADWLMVSLFQLVLIVLGLARVSQLAGAHADATRRLEQLADHDPLTGLANRRVVDRHLEALVRRVGSGHASGGVVLFIDLDGFKAVNDGLGHRVGDDLLGAVAGRLAGCVRSDHGDLVGRLGGDEFILVLEGAPAEVAVAASQRVADAFSTPFPIGEHMLRMTASIGIATATPGVPTTVDELLTQADHAMYARKRAATELPEA